MALLVMVKTIQLAWKDKVKQIETNGTAKRGQGSCQTTVPASCAQMCTAQVRYGQIVHPDQMITSNQYNLINITSSEKT